LIDLVEVDAKIIRLAGITEESLKAKPDLIRLLSQRLYLLEKLEGQ